MFFSAAEEIEEKLVHFFTSVTGLDVLEQVSDQGVNKLTKFE